MELAIDCRIHFKRGRSGRKRLVAGDKPTLPQVSPGNVPRVARLMALAIRLEGLVKGEAVHDYAELARLGQVSRARVTQIMNLLHLAPDIQEEILFLPRMVKGRDRIRERDLRPIAAVLDWASQRRMWCELTRNCLTSD